MPFEKTMGMAAAALVGTGLLIYGLYQRNRLRASQSWRQASGTITKADLAVHQDSESSSYSVALLYEYMVDGVRYTGKRIGFGGRQYVRKKRALQELERYPVNSSVAVYFDPEKPADAVLARESPDSLIMIAGGVLLLGIVVAGLLHDAL